MLGLRNLIRDHRRLAALLVALALSLKALVPAGYMIGGETKVLTIGICGDLSGANYQTQVEIPVKGQAGHGAPGAGKVDGHCPYSALAHAALAGTDPALLLAALAFILALGFAPASPAPHRRDRHLRPPSRGPPWNVRQIAC